MKECGGPISEQELVRRLFVIGCEEARYMGVARDSVEDCAQEFVVRMFRRMVRGNGTDTGLMPWNGAWVRRCARNHAIDFLRAEKARRQHEIRWSGHEEDSWRSPAEMQPEIRVLRAEGRIQILVLLMGFTAEQRDLFVRSQIQGESLADLAIAYGRTRHALEQSLSTIRKRLRRRLAERGLDEAQLREYLLS